MGVRRLQSQSGQPGPLPPNSGYCILVSFFFLKKNVEKGSQVFRARTCEFGPLRCINLSQRVADAEMRLHRLAIECQVN